MYILVIDDDQYANLLLRFVLKTEGYEAETLNNPSTAMHMIEKREPDLIILDVDMPLINGFKFAEMLRTQEYETPIIFLSAMDSPDDKLHGFNMGADDYICKPYNPKELIARVKAVLSRYKNQRKAGLQSIRSGQFELFPSELKIVLPNQAAISLTATEMKLLKMLMVYAGQVVEREQMLQELWNECDSNSNTIDVYIRRLRKKLEENAQKPQHIISIRGVGYKFVGSKGKKYDD